LIVDGSDKSTIEGGTFMEDGDPTGESSSVYSYQRRKPLPSSFRCREFVERREKSWDMMGGIGLRACLLTWEEETTSRWHRSRHICARHSQFVGKAVATMWSYNL
jgi:hypothetical protein